MSYIGVEPKSGFIKADQEKITGQTTNYVNLTNSISTLDDVQIWVNYVIQDPSTLTLNSTTQVGLGDTLVSSDVVLVTYLGQSVATQSPPVGGVSNDMLAGSIANSKLATDPLNASNFSSGTVPTARLGSGTASSSTVLFGDQTFKTAPSGALNFITEASSSSNHSEVVFDNCFTSTYENYLIIGDISVTNSGDTVRARLKNAGGQLQGSEYTYRFQRYSSDSNTSTNNTRATGDSYFQLTEGLNDNSARVGYTFKIYIFDPLSTSKRMGLRQESVTVNNSAVMDSVSGAGQYKDQTAITGILFYPSGNNFSNSTIRIYGISNS